MKHTLHKYIYTFAFLLFLIACSTKKDSWVNRNMHALSTKDNILYNGNIALNKGIKNVNEQYVDNFWEILPVERMLVVDEKDLGPEEKKGNADFETAELKANKGIQKHSMNIEGTERNPQMDEAYLLLGKARYYDQRFIPALEAFNYILYKSPTSDKIYEAKIWKEKTNIRLDNDAIAINSLHRILADTKFDKQQYADANAIMAQAFINLEQKDSAVANLKLAREYTKKNEEKARYTFIIGQLYQDLGYKDSATIAFETVIKMNRKSPRQYIIHSYVEKAHMFDYETGDVDAFLAKYNELVEDYENHNYLDILNYQMGVFYTNLNKPNTALSYYTSTLQTKSTDNYLVASTYRNMAEIYFKKANYIYAGKYYDSTLVLLQPRSREYFTIKKKRENLEDVIKYEGIVAKNDSIINVYNMPKEEQKVYYENYIAKLKASDEIKLKNSNKNPIGNVENGNQDPSANGNVNPNATNQTTTLGNSTGPSTGSFYFYNPQRVALGVAEFEKNWGKRPLVDNWKYVAMMKTTNLETEKPETTNITITENQNKEPAFNEAYTVDFYINKLPKSQSVIDKIVLERNFANYQLGIIYKEKFKEYQLAANKFESLLKSKPEERLVLPSMYNLYKIYLIIDSQKAAVLKDEIISKYPDSRYAQILSNSNSTNAGLTDTPIKNYEKLYKLYENGEYKTVLKDVDVSINVYTGDEMIPKFELLKAYAYGKVNGLEEFKRALNFVALTYPNSDEGKLADFMYLNDIPKMEALKFYEAEPTSWKIVFRTKDLESKETKTLLEKLNKYLKDRSSTSLKISTDIYTMTEYFIVIHGIKTEENANNIASVLKEYKDYKVIDKSYVISNDNYKIVQIKKNFEEYLKTPPTAPLPPKPVEPKNNTVTNPSKNDVVPTKNNKPAESQKQTMKPVQNPSIPNMNNPQAVPSTPPSTPPGMSPLTPPSNEDENKPVNKIQNISPPK
ncbi:MAG TPA: hypothetical protein VN192_01720 [Flavobacterium sp.]|nr:hypothetical protein [Flavobacterium sp.]